jgi:hypothetical protein
MTTLNGLAFAASRCHTLSRCMGCVYHGLLLQIMASKFLFLPSPQSFWVHDQRILTLLPDLQTKNTESMRSGRLALCVVRTKRSPVLWRSFSTTGAAEGSTSNTVLNQGEIKRNIVASEQPQTHKETEGIFALVFQPLRPLSTC